METTLPLQYKSLLFIHTRLLHYPEIEALAWNYQSNQKKTLPSQPIEMEETRERLRKYDLHIPQILRNFSFRNFSICILDNTDLFKSRTEQNCGPNSVVVVGMNTYMWAYYSRLCMLVEIDMGPAITYESYIIDYFMPKTF